MFSDQRKDYYNLLGVSKDASQEDIKKAFRKLAIQYHPDRNAGDKEKEKKFKEINEAYEVLGDQKKRAQYDQFGFVHQETGYSGASAGTEDFGDVFGGFEDIFDNFFGGKSSGSSRKSSRYQQKGRDLLVELEISFKDAFLGNEVNIQIPRNTACSTCFGTGAKKGYGKVKCSVCNGAGSIRKSQGFFSISSDCYQCRGSGEIIENPCLNCNGIGLVKEAKNIKVSIPRGIEDANKIKVSGEGDAVINGQNGDLYIQVRIRKDASYTRQDLDLFCNHSILFSQAVLGDEILITTLDGKLKLKIPPGTQNNHLFRFKDQGCYKVNTNRRGDLYIKINVIIPENLKLEERELLEKFADLRGESYQKNPSSFYEKIKKKFN